MDDLMNRQKALFEIGRFYELGETPSKEVIEYVIYMLDKEPCEDVISRQEAINAMFALCDTGETLEENKWRDNPYIDVIVDVLGDLPSVQTQDSGGWIPCSVRMPEEEGCYLVTASSKYGIEIEMRLLSKNGWLLFGHEEEHTKILAWQPLLKPWKPQESGNI